MGNNKEAVETWDTVEVNNGTKVNHYTKLVEGINKVRIVGNPHQYLIHFLTDKIGKMRKLNCAGDKCPACKDKPAQRRWLVPVINRATSSVQLLEAGTQIIGAVKTLNADTDWGTPSGYDINIKRGPAGSQPLYSVSPAPHKPLTADEKAMVAAFLAEVDLVSLTKPETVDSMNEKLGNPSTSFLSFE